MVIVTQNQYLLASKIHHIVMDENVNYIDGRNAAGKMISIRDVNYVIQIIYSPENVNSSNGQLSNSNDQRECSVTIRSAVNAHKVFRDLIQQIREQMPDQLYLDTALERMIASADLETLQAKDQREDDFGMTLVKALKSIGKVTSKSKKGKKNDKRAKALRKSGKTKGRGKALLRKTK